MAQRDIFRMPEDPMIIRLVGYGVLLVLAAVLLLLPLLTYAAPIARITDKDSGESFTITDEACHSPAVQMLIAMGGQDPTQAKRAYAMDKAGVENPLEICYIPGKDEATGREGWIFVVENGAVFGIYRDAFKPL